MIRIVNLDERSIGSFRVGEELSLSMVQRRDTEIGEFGVEYIEIDNELIGVMANKIVSICTYDDDVVLDGRRLAEWTADELVIWVSKRYSLRFEEWRRTHLSGGWVRESVDGTVALYSENEEVHQRQIRVPDWLATIQASRN